MADTPMRPPPIPPTIPPHIVPGARRIHVGSLLGLAEFLTSMGIIVSGGGGGGGGSSGGGLVLTDTATVTWDFTPTGAARANVVAADVNPYPPTVIPDGASFTVPTNTQVLFAEAIDVDGALVVDGSLIMVD